MLRVIGSRGVEDSAAGYCWSRDGRYCSGLLLVVGWKIV